MNCNYYLTESGTVLYTRDDWVKPGMRKCTKDGKLLEAQPVKQEAKPVEEPVVVAEEPAEEKTPAAKKTRKRKQAEEF